MEKANTHGTAKKDRGGYSACLDPPPSRCENAPTPGRRILAAGDYRVVTDEELIEELSFPVYRCVATMIFVPAIWQWFYG
jgi:hypothetical protein